MPNQTLKTRFILQFNPSEIDRLEREVGNSTNSASDWPYGFAETVLISHEDHLGRQTAEQVLKREPLTIDQHLKAMELSMLIVDMEAMEKAMNPLYVSKGPTS